MCVKRERSVWLLFGKIHRQCTRHDVIFGIGMRLRLHVCFSAHILSLSPLLFRSVMLLLLLLLVYVYGSGVRKPRLLHECSCVLLLLNIIVFALAVLFCDCCCFDSFSLCEFFFSIRSFVLVRCLSLPLLVAISLAFISYLSPRCVMQ